ncbi:MAG: ABC transporter permease [Meiothermus sp.]|uniref:ABC transporter permease n=1 Tax=Meiothermus sp. TaxID=1955249 RepID=UPI0025FD4C5C|nr:ABC transporter permease [Meiothermus sp.]MCX7740484.1 ABC transporter permease [Meiothermus sp.]MDW8425285.1 ABC transporter permease [Meiothermus sp.]
MGAGLLLGLALLALLAPWLAPYGPTEGDLLRAKQPPFWLEGGSLAHPLGTDPLGQDILSRLIYGARVSLAVGFFGVLLAAGLGSFLGLLAGYYGGRLDAFLTAASNLVLSLPYLVLVIVLATVMGRSLFNVVLLFGVTGSTVFYRLVRGETLRIREMPYLEAARSLGGSDGHILWRHVLPNLAGPLLTLASFEMSAMVFYEAGLGFLGLSVPPEVPSWGNMLALGRQFLTVYPWMAVFPGLAIALTALAMNLLGEWLRRQVARH